MSDDTLTAEAPVEVPDDAAAPAEAEVAAAPVTVEDIAAEKGWAPRDKWRGDPDKWKPADSFIRDTFDIADRVRRDLKHVTRQTETLVRTSAAIAKQQVEAARADYEQRLAEAVEAGDVGAVKAVTAQIARIDGPEASGTDFETDFASRNPWYGKDDEATAIAVAVSHRLFKQGRPVGEQLEAAEASVKRRFPELFGTTEPQRKAPLVAAPTTRTAAPSASRVPGVADLPPSARKAGENFVRLGLNTSLAEYAKVWHAENRA